MFQVHDKIVSADVLDKRFCCDLQKCKGICCVIGDAGAPLEKDEMAMIEEAYPIIKKYLPEKAIAEIDRQGLYVTDNDGDLVTPIIGHDECVYTFFEDGIAFCAFEKGFFAGEIPFRKPVSCHLYPIRTTRYTQFEAVNYDMQSFCEAARALGKKQDLPVYIFLKDVLIRKYGEEWYKELELVVEMRNALQ